MTHEEEPSGIWRIIDGFSQVLGPDFIAPHFERAITSCCRCGKMLGPESPDGDVSWHSTQVLVTNGVVSGLVVLIHCRDCPPEKLAGELRAMGTWPQKTEAWQMVEGS